MTNDSGHMALPAVRRTATLRAYQAGGQASPAAAWTLSGDNSVRLDLSFSPRNPQSPRDGVTRRRAATARPTAAGTASTTEAGMPVTGYSGWLLAGCRRWARVAASAGARRALLAHERVKSRD